MKLNLRKAIWVFALTVTLNVFSMSRLASAYQSEEGREHGHGHDKDNDNANNSNYQRGFSHGQDDGANNRNHQYRMRLDNDADRRAYEAGYDQGYQDNNRRGQYDHDRDANGDNNGHYGQYGHNGSNRNPGSQTGFHDGLNDGQQDRLTGHSNRPTKGDNYKNATRGYNSSLGGETQYKESYRQAYVQGYQQGYERNGQLGEYGQYGRNDNQAAQNGSQDGFNDGPRSAVVHPLDGIAFQRFWESRAFELGGGSYAAPAQLVGDFIKGQRSAVLGTVEPSYQPGVHLTDLGQRSRPALPDYAIHAVREALPAFERQIKGFSRADAMLTGVETRTSSPLRITRGRDHQSLNVRGLYPAGEGAGYAGGIMSAGVDGIEVAESLARSMLGLAG